MSELAQSKPSKEHKTEQLSRRSPEHASQDTPFAEILALQDTAGNRAVGQLLQSIGNGLGAIGYGRNSLVHGELGLSDQPVDWIGKRTVNSLMQPSDTTTKPIQTKLIVGSPGDQFEQEAEGVAESVMQMPAIVEGGASAMSANRTTTPATVIPPRLKSQLDVSRGQGQLLAPSQRTYFESRLGHDFSQVRVHAHSDAAESLTTSLGARAVTSGKDIWLGQGERPQDMGVMAHELTHVVQQQRGGLARASSAGPVPQIQLLRVRPDGQFAQALEEFTDVYLTTGLPPRPNNRPILLLRQSPTFRGMVRTLNRRYVYHNDPMRLRFTNSETGNVVRRGPFTGRRIIQVSPSMSGQAFFRPAGGPDSSVDHDLIVISAATEESFIQEIAHEAAHAVEFVTGRRQSPATIQAEVDQLIQEERRVRGTERRVVREIRGVPGGRGISLPTSPTTITAIERDFPRIGQRRTYLEEAFFGAALRRTVAQERVPRQQVESQVNRLLANVSNEDVNRFLSNPLANWEDITFQRRLPDAEPFFVTSSLGSLLFLRGIIHRSWTTFLMRTPEGSQGFSALKERKLQEHARALQQIGQAFFGETIAYTTLPPSSSSTSRRPSGTAQGR